MSALLTAIHFPSGDTIGWPYAGSFVDRVHHNITSTGTLSGTIGANPGDLVLDCVVSQAGFPDDHTIGDNQTLLSRISLNSGGSAKMSITSRLITTGDTSMLRSDLTSLNTIVDTKFITEMN